MQVPSLKIYIASSFRNIHAVHLLRDRLKEQWHTVLDFTKFAPPLPEALTPEQRRVAIDADERGDIFTFCTEACAQADLVIYLGASGQDSACEVGIAFCAGVPVYGLAGALEKPGTILSKAVTCWYQNTTELLNAVTMFTIEHSAECLIKKGAELELELENEACKKCKKEIDTDCDFFGLCHSCWCENDPNMIEKGSE